MTAPLAEVVLWGNETVRAAKLARERDTADRRTRVFQMEQFFIEHGPRLLAVAEAGERLWDYAAHAPICVYPAKPCDCGLNEALAQWYAAAKGEK